jgi:hypothetical protein
MDGEFSKHLATQGTARALTTHDTPEYNGVSERLNRTLLERTRAFFHSSELPKFLWGEAVNHAVWLKNRTPTHALPTGKTPYEMLHGKKPDLSNLPEWGVKIWVHDDSGTKLDGRSKIGRWIGHDEPSNAHRIYWPEKCSITIERSVKFDNGDVLIPRAIPIEGEKKKINQIHAPNSDVNSNSNSNSINRPSDSPGLINNELPTDDVPPTNNDWLGSTFNRVTDELSAARSQRVRKPSEYMR